MSFKEFDLTDYIHALENFNMFVNKAKEEKSQVAQLAITHFGNVENYTNAKLGDGASDYIVRAFRYYGGNEAS